MAKASKDLPEWKIRPFEYYDKASSYRVTPETVEPWPEDSDPPLITRYLDQEDLHQLVKELLVKQDETYHLDLYVIDDILNIKKEGDGWRISSEDGKSIVCTDISCAEEVLVPRTIEIIVIDKVFQYRINDQIAVLYDNRYPFRRSPGQQDILEKFFPDKEFEYPKENISEDEYLEELRKNLENENQQLRQTLNSFLDPDSAKLVQAYASNPEAIKRKRFLEAKFPNASLISSYLG